MSEAGSIGPAGNGPVCRMTADDAAFLEAAQATALSKKAPVPDLSVLVRLRDHFLPQMPRDTRAETAAALGLQQGGSADDLDLKGAWLLLKDYLLPPVERKPTPDSVAAKPAAVISPPPASSAPLFGRDAYQRAKAKADGLWRPAERILRRAAEIAQRGDTKGAIKLQRIALIPLNLAIGYYEDAYRILQTLPRLTSTEVERVVNDAAKVRRVRDAVREGRLVVELKPVVTKIDSPPPVRRKEDAKPGRVRIGAPRKPHEPEKPLAEDDEAPRPDIEDTEPRDPKKLIKTRKHSSRKGQDSLGVLELASGSENKLGAYTSRFATALETIVTRNFDGDPRLLAEKARIPYADAEGFLFGLLPQTFNDVVDLEARLFLRHGTLATPWEADVAAVQEAMHPVSEKDLDPETEGLTRLFRRAVARASSDQTLRSIKRRRIFGGESKGSFVMLSRAFNGKFPVQAEELLRLYRFLADYSGRDESNIRAVLGRYVRAQQRKGRSVGKEFEVVEHINGRDVVVFSFDHAFLDMMDEKRGAHLLALGGERSRSVIPPEGVDLGKDIKLGKTNFENEREFSARPRAPGDLRERRAMDEREVVLAGEMESFRSPEDVVERVELAREMRRALATLLSKEERILRRRFGIDGSKAKPTLEDIAGKMDITRGWVQKIEAAGLQKLRHPIRSKRLLQFVDVNYVSPGTHPSPLVGEGRGEALPSLRLGSGQAREEKESIATQSLVGEGRERGESAEKAGQEPIVANTHSDEMEEEERGDRLGRFERRSVGEVKPNLRGIRVNPDGTAALEGVRFETPQFDFSRIRKKLNRSMPAVKSVAGGGLTFGISVVGADILTGNWDRLKARTVKSFAGEYAALTVGNIMGQALAASTIKAVPIFTKVPFAGGLVKRFLPLTAGLGALHVSHGEPLSVLGLGFGVTNCFAASSTVHGALHLAKKAEILRKAAVVLKLMKVGGLTAAGATGGASLLGTALIGVAEMVLIEKFAESLTAHSS